MDKNAFHKIVNGKTIDIFKLSNSNGVSIEIINYGAKVVSINVPDKDGIFKDIVLGYDNIDDYLNLNLYYGATIGRNANRIAKGKIEIEGNNYNFAINNGKNHLHGGLVGFNDVIWDAKFIDGKEQSLELTYLSVDGEENYPGNVTVKLIYTLTEDNELKIDYLATTDKTTVVNLTHHSYFNLAGEGNDSIENHKIMINADKFTPLDKTQIPTGEIRDVTNTPFDLREFTTIADKINLDDEQLKIGSGYDHNWMLKNDKNTIVLAASVYEPNSRRCMEVYTNQPGIQLYTGNFVCEEDGGKGDNKYKHRSALCLETQHFPDAPNHNNFISSILKPNEKYNYTCIYKFSVKQ